MGGAGVAAVSAGVQVAWGVVAVTAAGIGFRASSKDGEGEEDKSEDKDGLDEDKDQPLGKL